MAMYKKNAFTITMFLKHKQEMESLDDVIRLGQFVNSSAGLFTATEGKMILL